MVMPRYMISIEYYIGDVVIEYTLFNSSSKFE
jgi:hypothetical protein